jgi:hypothetical protein
MNVVHVYIYVARVSKLFLPKSYVTGEGEYVMVSLPSMAPPLFLQ